MKNNSTQRLMYVTLLCAMATVVNVLETSLVGTFGFGFFRFGLANIFALVALYLFGIKEMLIVNVMRVTLGNLLRGTIFGTTFFIAFSGVFLSTVVLILFYFLKSSKMFTSIMSSLAHSLGQILMVSFFYSQVGMIVLYPYFIIISIPTGIAVGFIAIKVIERIQPRLKYMK